MKSRFLILNKKDNCATALEDIPQDAKLKILDDIIEVKQKIALGHKIATEYIGKGDSVIKYGEVIGIATDDIKKGDWIHTHNITSTYFKRGDK
ncbi:MAG: UxaA family hydrolase [Promethearchaeota archaeon]|jgi:hypothetical protein